MSPILPNVPAMSMTATRMTTPATRVRFSDWKIAPIVFTSWFGNGVEREKSLARSSAPGEPARGRRNEDHDLSQRKGGLHSLAPLQEARDGPQQAWDRDEREERNAHVVQIVRITDEAQPAPAGRRMGPFDELRNGQ